MLYLLGSRSDYILVNLNQTSCAARTYSVYRGVTREGHEGRAHPPKNFDFGVQRKPVERSLLPNAVFLIQVAECRPQLKSQRSLLQAVCHWNVAGKARKKRKKTASFVASLRWRTAAIERTPCDLSCLSAIRDNLLPCLWPSKRKPRHCGESTGKSD